MALGWNCLGNLAGYADMAELHGAYVSAYGDEKPAKVSNAVSMLHRFAQQISAGDLVITYMPDRRVYLLGEDLGEYRHVTEDEWVDRYANIRPVRWLSVVSRDDLSKAVQNSLGATLTLFSLKHEVVSELQSHARPVGSELLPDAGNAQLSLPGCQV
ncbi:restriction endonuclease [Aliamphritea spongicola]|uniref:restriction endonuclease n=1 Tax=Aliamphritea spongicola TaxID=707589 RepID=UPI00196A9FEB|nr:hypothetical protein [Aliamphritea spongicola]MBN3564850.1 hypothetical protein [Aliamphritea spongicola]